MAARSLADTRDLRPKRIGTLLPGQVYNCTTASKFTSLQLRWHCRCRRCRDSDSGGPSSVVQRNGTHETLSEARSARGTIRAGRRFTYRDPEKAEARVGYYDVRRERLTMLTDDESAIVSHFSGPVRSVRRLPAPDY